MTIYSLTLEERATCPTNCEQWDNCYGDNMPFGHRFNHTDDKFIYLLDAQLEHLNRKHTEGFVVRLHVLGDFYNLKYLLQWVQWLNQFNNLRVFGYTHHPFKSELGDAIKEINSSHTYSHRFRIRFSDDWNTRFSAHVGINTNNTGGIMCPEQIGKTDSCATCGYCWSSDQPVVFIEH